MESGEESKRGGCKEKIEQRSELPAAFSELEQIRAGAPSLAVLQHYNRGRWTRQRTQDVHVLWTRPRTQVVPFPSCSSSALLKGRTFNESTSWSPSSLPANR